MLTYIAFLHAYVRQAKYEKHKNLYDVWCDLFILFWIGIGEEIVNDLLLPKCQPELMF